MSCINLLVTILGLLFKQAVIKSNAYCVRVIDVKALDFLR
jgi:hypothetical protein